MMGIIIIWCVPGCACVIEFEECVLAEIEEMVSGRFNFHIQGHLLEFYGMCADCKK